MPSVRQILIFVLFFSLILAEFVVSTENNATTDEDRLEEFPSAAYYKTRQKNNGRGGAVVRGGSRGSAAPDQLQRRVDSPAGGTKKSHPFGFEYRSPHPSPFQKTFGNFPQITRNQDTAESQSVGQIIKLLSDKMYEDGKFSSNPNRRVKFSGIYLNPRKSDDQTRFETRELAARASSVNGHAYNADPFFPFKPTQPGDVNLLAEHAFRFAPSFAQDRNHRFSGQKGCSGAACRPALERPLRPGAQEDAISYEGAEASGIPKKVNKERPFSVMLDVYPINNRDEEVIAFPEHLKEPIVKPKPKPAFYPPNYPPPYYLYYHPGHHHPGFRQTWAGRGGQEGLPVYPLSQPPQTSPPRPHAGRGSKIKGNIPVQMLIHLNLYPQKKINVNEVRGENNERMDTNPASLVDSDYKDDRAGNLGEDYFGERDKNLSRLRKVLSESFDSKVLSNSSKNITIEEIRKGHGFVLPGPKILFLPPLNSTLQHL